MNKLEPIVDYAIISLACNRRNLSSNLAFNVFSHLKDENVVSDCMIMFGSKIASICNGIDNIENINDEDLRYILLQIKLKKNSPNNKQSESDIRVADKYSQFDSIDSVIDVSKPFESYISVPSNE